MSILVVSCSLSPESKSRILAEAAFQRLRRAGVSSDYVDMRTKPLPLCDGDQAYADANVQEMSAAVGNAQGIILAVPIYNFDANAVAKNLVELTGRAWTGKVVGFLCAAGGQGSYMSIMALANSLMLDFRCIVVPRFVYATGESFRNDAIADADLAKRVDELADVTLKFATALSAEEAD